MSGTINEHNKDTVIKTKIYIYISLTPKSMPQDRTTYRMRNKTIVQARLRPWAEHATARERGGALGNRWG